MVLKLHDPQHLLFKRKRSYQSITECKSGSLDVPVCSVGCSNGRETVKTRRRKFRLLYISGKDKICLYYCLLCLSKTWWIPWLQELKWVVLSFSPLVTSKRNRKSMHSVGVRPTCCCSITLPCKCSTSPSLVSPAVCFPVV